MAAHNVNPPSPEQMLSPVYSNKCSDWAQASRAEYQEYLNTLRQMRRDLRRVERVIRRLEKNVALDSRGSCSGLKSGFRGGAAVQMQCQAEDQRLLSGKVQSNQRGYLGNEA